MRLWFRRWFRSRRVYRAEDLQPALYRAGRAWWFKGVRCMGAPYVVQSSVKVPAGTWIFGG